MNLKLVWNFIQGMPWGLSIHVASLDGFTIHTNHTLLQVQQSHSIHIHVHRILRLDIILRNKSPIQLYNVGIICKIGIASCCDTTREHVSYSYVLPRCRKGLSWRRWISQDRDPQRNLGESPPEGKREKTMSDDRRREWNVKKTLPILTNSTH